MFDRNQFHSFRARAPRAPSPRASPVAAPVASATAKTMTTTAAAGFTTIKLKTHGADPAITGRVTVGSELVAEIEMMFSHIDQNLAGIEFPEHNFVFTEQFTELLKTFKVNAEVKI